DVPAIDNSKSTTRTASKMLPVRSVRWTMDESGLSLIAPLPPPRHPSNCPAPRWRARHWWRSAGSKPSVVRRSPHRVALRGVEPGGRRDRDAQTTYELLSPAARVL